MFLARKITRAKWKPKQELSAGEISADAVTCDLKTQDNSLSFWVCGSGEKAEVEEAALAIAAPRDRVDRLDIVWFSDDELQGDDQTLRKTEGKTPVTGLTKLHVDVCRLDYVRLGKVARHVVTAIERGRYFRLTKACVTKLLAAAVKQKRVDLADFKENVQIAVRKSLEAKK